MPLRKASPLPLSLTIIRRRISDNEGKDRSKGENPRHWWQIIITTMIKYQLINT